MTIDAQRLSKTITLMGDQLDRIFDTLYPDNDLRLAPCVALTSNCRMTVIMKGVSQPRTGTPSYGDAEVVMGVVYIACPHGIKLPSGAYSIILRPREYRGTLRDVDGEDVAWGNLSIERRDGGTSAAPIEFEFHGVCSIDLNSSFSKPLELEICCDATTDQSAPFGASTMNCLRIDLTPFLL